MNKIQRGIVESIVGIVGGIVLTTIINAFVQDGLLPRYFIALYGLFVIIANIATIRTLRLGGILYTLGWLIGSYMFRDLFGPLEIAINIAAPIIILLVRIALWVMDAIRKYS